MIIYNLFIFVASLVVLIKSAEIASRYSSSLARQFHMSEFTLSFFVVAVISTFPEAAVSVMSAIEGVPEFGLVTLLGSNVADLTLVIGLVALFSDAGIKVRSRVLRKDFLYLFLLMFPFLLGMDGHFSRPDGVLLILSGLFFFFTLSIEVKMFHKELPSIRDKELIKDIFLLLLGIGLLFASAHFTVNHGVMLAEELRLPPILIGLLMVSLGTCLPEMLFSLRSIKTHHDGLAIGDILGTVIIDATIWIGMVAIIRPYTFNPHIVISTGIAMFIAGLLTMLFIRNDKLISKKEGIVLVFFYIVFLLVQSLFWKLLQ